jgi:hypothetical protein
MLLVPLKYQQCVTTQFCGSNIGILFLIIAVGSGL